MAEQSIIWQPVDVANELEEMGLDREGLEHAVRVAAHERSFVTDNDAIGFGSYLVYGKAGRGLRDWYLPKGWIKDDSNNQCAIKHSDLKLRIVPCNFNEFAGSRTTRPTNKSPKGEVSKNKSACNRTAWLPGLDAPLIPPEFNDGFQTWVLGMHIDNVTSAGAELSWPVGFDGHFFTQFGKRIILLSGDDNDGVGARKNRDDGPIDVVDIAIKRR